jgi:hypothetical protein
MMTLRSHMTMLLLLLGFVFQGSPAATPLPPPITAGVEALEAGRCDDAFKQWSPTVTSPGTNTGAVQRLTDCAALKRLGTLHGHEVLRVVSVGTRVRRVYLLLRYQAQPVYIVLVAYQPADEWQVIRTSWSVNADRILPPTMAPPERAEP